MSGSENVATETTVEESASEGNAVEEADKSNGGRKEAPGRTFECTALGNESRAQSTNNNLTCLPRGERPQPLEL